MKGDRLVSIDPGVSACGVAHFEGTELLSAHLVRGKTLLDTVDKTIKACDAGRAVIEFPRVYPLSRSKADPNDLIRVALVSGGVAGGLVSRAEIRLVEPWQWSKLPKDVKNARTRALLSAEEKTRIGKCPKSLLHNVLDAVAIGLWALGRW